MKTNKYQWMKDLHLMTFVYLGILYLLIFVFSCRIPICIYLFVILSYFFSSSTVLFMKTKEREIRSSFWLGFVVMMVILSCSSQWLTEDALGRTLCIWCILALYLHSCSFLLFCEAIFLHKEILYSMVNYYWSFHATLHWLHGVLNCKFIIILMEVFRCRTKTTGYHH